MKQSTCVLIFVIAISMVLCEQTCHERPTMQNFDFSLFQGEWNTLMASIVPRSGICIQQSFQEGSPNSSITLKFGDRRQNETVAYNGLIWKTDSPGKLEFTILNEFPETSLPYWVLDTDYHNYAVTYICWRQSPIGRDYITVLGRNTSLSDEARTAVNALLESINLVPDQLVEVSHTGCPTTIYS